MPSATSEPAGRARSVHARDKAMPPREVSVGLTGKATLQVSGDDTAISQRSGEVEVLATPRLIALCEEASNKALAGRLGAGRTSVATRVQFDHFAPVAVGETVGAEATLQRVEGRRLVFTLSASLRSEARGGLVGAGRLTRVLVDREAFLGKAGLTVRT